MNVNKFKYKKMSLLSFRAKTRNPVKEIDSCFRRNDKQFNINSNDCRKLKNMIIYQLHI